MSNPMMCKEPNGLFQILNFRLQNRFRKFGLIGAILIFISLIAYKFMGSDALIVKDLMRSLILLFLLSASLSKDKIEDEYSSYVRFQSFLISFVFTAAYAILIPLIAILLDFVITNFLTEGTIGFYEISTFEILFTMLGMQLLSYETLKRFGRV